MILEVNDLCFSRGNRRILNHINFCAKQGEFLSILGSNGVGKSTLFRCMLNLLSTYTGQVLIDSIDSRKLSPSETAQKIAYIPQSCSPTFNLSVEDVVMMGNLNRVGLFSVPGSSEEQRVRWALEKTGISNLSQRCFHHLSGGERQLVIIARALVQDAKILLLDEPTASLDYGNQIRVLNQMRALADEGYTIIQTTHSPEHAYMFSDRIIALSDGSILADGRPEDVLTSEIIGTIYGIEVQISSLNNDSVRICTPQALPNEPRCRMQ